MPLLDFAFKFVLNQNAANGLLYVGYFGALLGVIPYILGNFVLGLLLYFCARFAGLNQRVSIYNYLIYFIPIVTFVLLMLYLVLFL